MRLLKKSITHMNETNLDEDTQKALKEVDANRNETDLEEETRKVLEEVDANRNKTDLDEETQKALEDMVSNGPSCRTRCGVERIKRPALEPVVVPPGVVDPMWCRVVRAKLNLKIRRKWSQ